jgi:hypothetical protein
MSWFTGALFEFFLGEILPLSNKKRFNAKCTKGYKGLLVAKKLHRNRHILRGKKSHKLPYLDKDFLEVSWRQSTVLKKKLHLFFSTTQIWLIPLVDGSPIHLLDKTTKSVTKKKTLVIRVYIFLHKTQFEKGTPLLTCVPFFSSQVIVATPIERYWFE